MYAIQGAMAIRRQRQMRENRRLSQIRMNAKGSGSRRPSESGSVAPDPAPLKGPPKAETSQTAFYLGVVFILLGFLIIFSSMISSSATETDWSRLLGVGVTFLLVGLIMVMVNRIITAKEEEELTRYVSHRLGRSRSGHTLVRDIESGEDFHHHHMQRSAKVLARSPRPSTVTMPRSPRDKTTDPFPKFKQGSQASTRAGSTIHSPVTPHPTAVHGMSKSCSTNSNLAPPVHIQNGHKPIPLVISDPDGNQTCIEKPIEESQEIELSNGSANQLESVVSPTLTENGSPACDSSFFPEVISETETLLKSDHNNISYKKMRAKKNANYEPA